MAIYVNGDRGTEITNEIMAGAEFNRSMRPGNNPHGIIQYQCIAFRPADIAAQFIKLGKERLYWRSPIVTVDSNANFHDNQFSCTIDRLATFKHLRQSRAR